MTDQTNYIAPIDFRIAQRPPVGIPRETLAAFNELYSFSQQVIQALITECGIGSRLPTDWSLLSGSSGTLLSGNLRRFYTVAEEALAIGDVISLHSTGGLLKARKANATNNTKSADGFVELAPIAMGAVGEVILSTGVLITVGLTQGNRYFLSAAVSGGITAVAPVAAGNIEQYLGIALSTTELYFNSGYWIQH